jgi:hypothetical protein
LRPDLAGAHYNLACMLAQGGSPKRALAALSKALSLSPTYATKAAQDKDLTSLRAMPEFRRLLQSR